MIPHTLDEPKYLYYSEEAERVTGYGIFEGETGNKIKATAAVSDPNYLGTIYKWKDAKFVGMGIKILESRNKYLTFNDIQSLLN